MIIQTINYGHNIIDLINAYWRIWQRLNAFYLINYWRSLMVYPVRTQNLLLNQEKAKKKKKS